MMPGVLCFYKQNVAEEHEARGSALHRFQSELEEAAINMIA